jgi:hypothetical protein
MHASMVFALCAIPLAVFAQGSRPKSAAASVSDLVAAQVNTTKQHEAGLLEKRLSCPNGHHDASSCYTDICSGVGLDDGLDSVAW